MNNEQMFRARAAIREAGCDFALSTSLQNVTYISGYTVPVPVGALAELSYAAPLALLGATGGSHLVVPNAVAEAARTQSWMEAVTEFETFDSFSPTDSQASFLDAIETTLCAAGLANATATLGVEGRTMPHALTALLQNAFPRLSLLEIGPALQSARLIKTEREISLLRRAAAIGDVAHRKLEELVRQAGANECEMWGGVTAAVNHAVGTEITISGELVTGPRTCVVAYPAGPKSRTAEAGDAALMDISGRVDGYWFDVTNTHVFGDAEPTAQQRKYARASQDACEAAMAALSPGRLASDASEAARAAFEKHGLTMAHYSGHQIGVAVNELPRLVPYDHTPIEAGMVFSVEPGAYEGPGGSFGARSEKMVLVTENGPEILSQFSWGIA